MESGGNITTSTAATGVSSEDKITNLINKLETGDRETGLSAAAELGRNNFV